MRAEPVLPASLTIGALRCRRCALRTCLKAKLPQSKTPADAGAPTGACKVDEARQAKLGVAPRTRADIKTDKRVQASRFYEQRAIRTAVLHTIERMTADRAIRWYHRRGGGSCRSRSSGRALRGPVRPIRVSYQSSIRRPTASLPLPVRTTTISPLAGEMPVRA